MSASILPHVWLQKSLRETLPKGSQIIYLITFSRKRFKTIGDNYVSGLRGSAAGRISNAPSTSLPSSNVVTRHSPGPPGLLLRPHTEVGPKLRQIIAVRVRNQSSAQNNLLLLFVSKPSLCVVRMRRRGLERWDTRRASGSTARKTTGRGDGPTRNCRGLCPRCPAAPPGRPRPLRPLAP